MSSQKVAHKCIGESREAEVSGAKMNDNTAKDDVEIGNLAPAGVQLYPVPSDDPDDPLNWPMWLKVVVLAQTSLLAAVGGLNTATINPALLQLAHDFEIDKVKASYQTTVCIALNGIAPWLWIPLAYKYGRRPVFLGTTLLGFITILGCAFTQTYTQLLVARIFNGFFPVGFALGATTVTDLFFFHQRGRAMGFFTVTVVNGSHFAPIIGGLLGQYGGWRWIFKFLAIVDGVLFITAFFCLPETMYHRQNTTTKQSTSKLAHVRPAESENTSSFTLPPLRPVSSHISTHTLVMENPTRIRPRSKFQAYAYYLRLQSSNPNYNVNYISTITPTLRLFLCPTAIFPAIYYASTYGFASILPAVTVAAIFTEYFHWNTLRIGLSFGAALTLGGILGECFAGWICDAIVTREQKRLSLLSGPLSKPKPEIRLRPIWPGAVLTPAGLLIYGFTLHYHRHPSLPLFGMFLSCFGLQIITTCTYTYAIDCARDQTNTTANVEESNKFVPSTETAEIAQLFNFIRQMFGFTFAFYVVRMGDRIGYQWTFTIFSICGILAFLPVMWLIFRRSR